MVTIDGNSPDLEGEMNMNFIINFKIAVGANKKLNKQMNKHFMEGNYDRFNEIWFY